jgi:hypothetical protein
VLSRNRNVQRATCNMQHCIQHATVRVVSEPKPPRCISTDCVHVGQARSPSPRHVLARAALPSYALAQGHYSCARARRMIATLYSAIWLQSTLLATPLITVQCAALLWCALTALAARRHHPEHRTAPHAQRPAAPRALPAAQDRAGLGRDRVATPPHLPRVPPLPAEGARRPSGWALRGPGPSRGPCQVHPVVYPVRADGRRRVLEKSAQQGYDRVALTVRETPCAWTRARADLLAYSTRHRTCACLCCALHAWSPKPPSDEFVPCVLTVVGRLVGLCMRLCKS